jgi:hypothetical protein
MLLEKVRPYIEKQDSLLSLFFDKVFWPCKSASKTLVKNFDGLWWNITPSYFSKNFDGCILTF